MAHAWGAGAFTEAHLTALSLLLALPLTPQQAKDRYGIVATEVISRLPWPGQVQVRALPAARQGWEATQIFSVPAAGPPELRIESQVLCNWHELGDTAPTTPAESCRLYVDDYCISPAAGRTALAKALKMAPVDHDWGAGIGERYLTAVSLLLALQISPWRVSDLYETVATEVISRLPWPGQVQVRALPAARQGWEATQTYLVPGPPSELRIESQVLCNWRSLGNFRD